MFKTPLAKGAMSIVAVIGAAALVAGVFQNCAGFKKAVVSPQEKTLALESARIFAAETIEAPSADSASGNVNQVAAGNQILTQFIPLRLMCSDVNSQRPTPQAAHWGGALSMASQLRIQLVKVENNQTVVGCNFVLPNTPELKDLMMNQKKLPMTAIADRCQSTPYGTYFLLIQDVDIDPAYATTIYAHNTKRQMDHMASMKASTGGEDLLITRSADGWKANERAQMVLADRNPRANQDTRPFAYLTQAEQCDADASPLMVKLTPSSGGGTVGLKLTDQSNGVLFNALGDTAIPANTPVRVSWVTSDNFGFIVLPDANNQVSGINDLFGDRTRGPDNNFSLNGYEALAKWDGRPHPRSSLPGGLPDGMIDESDPVFEQLRLWIDHTRDGVAQANELYPLSQFKIRLLDLSYDPRYYERDVYGNQIRYKSVAQTKDGRLLTVFDLWWNYEGDSQTQQ